MKSFASFYGQLNKALRCISNRLVSPLATLPYTSSFHSISNRGKWACSSRIGASHRMDQAQHGLFSNRGCIQRTSIWVPGGAISHFGLFRIRILFGKNEYDKVRRFYFLDTFSFYIFQNYLNAFSLIVICIMTLCIPKLL